MSSPTAEIETTAYDAACETLATVRRIDTESEQEITDGTKTLWRAAQALGGD